MANKLIIDGEVVLGSVDSASSIICKDTNNNNSNVQNELDKINNNIDNINNNITTLNNKIPFSFGVDANGNYGYIKDGADTVTPFKKGHNIESPKTKISGAVTSVTCNNCIVGNIYTIIYAPWSGAGYSQAASYLSVSSYSGCEAPTQLYTLNDGYRSTVGVFKVKATSTTFKIQWHTSGGGYIIVCE